MPSVMFQSTYALSTAMTSNISERTLLISRGCFFDPIAIFLPIFLLPLVRVRLGGWINTMLVFALFCVVTMIPVCFKVKERVASIAEEDKADPSLKEMLSYVFTNKYLLFFYIGVLIYYTFNISSTMSLFVARYCFGNESFSSVMSLALLAPPIACALLVPPLQKKIDKFRIFIAALIFMNAMCVVIYFIGMKSFPLFIVFTVLRGVGFGFVSTLLYAFIGDCCEYGTYKTGCDAKEIAFATHTFFTKLMGATCTAFSSLCLHFIGYVEGEGTTQLESLPHNMWILYCLVPVIGIFFALPVFAKYKLNDKDVNLMAQCNAGKLIREEADAKMSRKY